MENLKKNLSASEVIDLLIQGNSRFVNGLRSIDTFMAVMNKKTLAEKGQKPFCTLITCSDSRIPIELIFDRGLGDLFVIRSLGNTIDPSIIGSIEYSLLNFGLEVVIIMGHSRSGAIRLTMEMEGTNSIPKSSHLQAVIEQIRPSLNQARIKNNYFGKLEKNSKSPELNEHWERIYQSTCQEHIRACCQKIQDGSLIISERIAQGNLFVIPALYDIASGQTIFELPGQLATKLDPKVVQLEAFKQAKTALEILQKSLPQGRSSE